MPFKPPTYPIKPGGVCFCAQSSAEAGWRGQYFLDAFEQVQVGGHKGHADSCNWNNAAGPSAERPLFPQIKVLYALADKTEIRHRSIFRNRCRVGAIASI